MRVGTLFKSLAPFLIASNKSPTLPVFTKFCVVSEQIGFSPEILKIVRIDALSFIMVVIEGAPFCLKIEYEEIIILVKLKQVMNEPDFYVFNWVSKRAEFSVVTGLCFIRVEMTEFSFILVLVI